MTGVALGFVPEPLVVPLDRILPSRKVPADRQGRMRPDALRAERAMIDGPVIVCVQAGNVEVADRAGPFRRRSARGSAPRMASPRPARHGRA